MAKIPPNAAAAIPTVAITMIKTTASIALLSQAQRFWSNNSGSIILVQYSGFDASGQCSSPSCSWAVMAMAANTRVSPAKISP